MPQRHDDSSPVSCESDRPRSGVVTDRAPIYPRVLEKLVPAARHGPIGSPTPRSRSISIEGWLGPMRGLKRPAAAHTMAAGHAFVENLRRGHHAISADLPQHDRVRAGFDELALVL